jgi:NAD(P)-dependent dehydrogenase (short-subunit alcohol dehydrogenase family)
MRLKDKVAIITGGSQGIGEALSRRYAAEGAIVAIVNRRGDIGERVASEIRAEGNVAYSFVADITSVEGVKRVVGEVADKFGGVDILVNNAGLYLVTPVATTTEADFQAMIDVNMKAVFFLSQTVIPQFLKRGGGKILNLGSIFGNDGFPSSAVYCATKAAVALFTKSMCLELREHNICVNSIAPGFIRTPMNAQLQVNDDFNKVATGRYGGDNVWMEPEELTGAAIFLSSSDADSVNGTTLYVDRGWSSF